MNCTNFTYDGIKASTYNLMICSFNSPEDGSAETGNQIELSTFKPPASNKWYQTNANYSTQLTISFSICKDLGDAYSQEELYFTEREAAFILRWLVRKEYHDLCFLYEDSAVTTYHCQITANRHIIHDRIAGFDLTAVCDAPFGYSAERVLNASTSGSSTILLLDDSDEIGILYPEVTITCKTAGDISIHNAMENRTTIIKNCKAGEVITMNQRMEIQSSYESAHIHPSFPEDFNWVFLRIANTLHSRTNALTLEGNFDLALKWKSIRKAVM